MNVGSVFAYEPTHSIATKGAMRQSAMTTRDGCHDRPPVHFWGVLTSGGSVPSTDHLCNAQAI